MRTHALDSNETPSWDTLFDVAQAQLGYFTTRQAAAAGYSPQLLYKYLNNGKMLRIRRGFYRLQHFPTHQGEDFVPLWLWTEHQGVFSHDTAIAFHDLSDHLPSQTHITLPDSWRRRRLRVPDGVVLHFADLESQEREHAAVVPVTSPARTLQDCLDANLDPNLIRQAVTQASRRGLISDREQAELSLELERRMASA